MAKIVKQWYQDLWKAGRNITADNVFPDFKLADDLLKNCTTYFGTVRKNKKTIPAEFISKKNVENSSIFGFYENTILVSHAPKQNKCMELLSTMHYHKEVIGKVANLKLSFIQQTKRDSTYG